MSDLGDPEPHEKSIQVQESLDAIKKSERERDWSPFGVVAISGFFLWVGGVTEDSKLTLVAVMVITAIAAVWRENLHLKTLMLKMELREYLRDDWPKFGTYSKTNIDLDD